MIKIVPSILTNDITDLTNLLNKCERVVDRVHIDIIDGIFANNKTILPEALENYEGALKFDYHLMVKDPIHWVEKAVRCGGDRIIGQIEMMHSQKDFINKVYETGAKAGLGLDLETPVSKIERDVLKDVDIVLVMSVPAGFGGQKFHNGAIQKIELLDRYRASDQTPFMIQDDGGITLERMDDVNVSGVEESIVGRRLFEGGLSDNIKKFQNAAHKQMK